MIAHRNVGSKNWKKPESNGDENRIMRMIVGMRPAAKKISKTGRVKRGEMVMVMILELLFQSVYQHRRKNRESRSSQSGLCGCLFISITVSMNTTPRINVTVTVNDAIEQWKKRITYSISSKPTSPHRSIDIFIYLFVQSHQSLMKFMNNAEQIECLKPHLLFQVINI